MMITEKSAFRRSRARQELGRRVGGVDEPPGEVAHKKSPVTQPLSAGAVRLAAAFGSCRMKCTNSSAETLWIGRIFEGAPGPSTARGSRRGR